MMDQHWLMAGMDTHACLAAHACTDVSAKAIKATTAMEARTLQWLAWASRVVDAAGAPADSVPAPGSTDDQTGPSAAAALAAVRPYEVSLADVRLQLPTSGQLPQAEVAYVLNGTLVGLLVEPHSPAQEQLQHVPLQPQQQQPRPLPVCLGVGLVRAVDANRGVLYLLTDLPEEQLQTVTTLQVGRLELPRALVQTPSLAPPYSALFALSSAAAGAGVIKSRNNLLRASLMA